MPEKTPEPAALAASDASSGVKKRLGRAALPRSAVRIILLAALAAALWYVLSGIRYHWDWGAVWAYREIFAWGLVTTVAVSAGAMVLGLAIGVLSGLASVSRGVWLSELAGLYVGAFRGTPLLVQILIFYFCVGVVVRLDSPYVIGAVTLAFFSGAYISEMVRAGIESVDRGQWEAAAGTGLSRSLTLRHVILPQALRRIVPPVTGQFVSLIKDSSLLSIIAVRELTKAAEVVNATTYKTFETYLPLAGLYLLLTWPLARLTRRLERGIQPEGQIIRHL
ncbi:amino acid ABC transporter permease [Desulfolutivibrio sulfoxidireducens]|uniref:amino acid ABC transporter permease n=1 Tax=Desulfolutivibrio sulfoxidireducens TaxID=2773299 RepID=UPI00159DCB12|nr:amino acid ABC transporter permease [Desulfolutivibrio sulfoxidireducens]QLA15251.1 ABC transporter permease subunit [Desulfolutivibrio sulfoxidireducens]